MYVCIYIDIYIYILVKYISRGHFVTSLRFGCYTGYRPNAI